MFNLEVSNNFIHEQCLLYNFTLQHFHSIYFQCFKILEIVNSMLVGCVQYPSWNSCMQVVGKQTLQLMAEHLR